MSIPRGGKKGKCSERPEPCRCGSPAWWYGRRVVSSVRLAGNLVEHVTGIVRRRASCSSKQCPIGSWTVYEGESYPHRLFDLAVLVSAVSMVVFGGATLTAAAGAHQCSRESVRRWKRWVSELAYPKFLMRACTRLDAEGVPGALELKGTEGAGVVLHLLDRLAVLLAGRGRKLPALGSGLGQLLREQLARFGDIFYLTKVSPPLLADTGEARI